jgi:4-hydroxy-tetrahydrodipicolinate synthase
MMNKFDLIRKKIKGPAFAIITPFTEGGKDVDWEAVKNYVKFLYDGGAKVFYVMAYNSRFSLLSDDEIMTLNELVVKTVKSFNDDECITIVADPLHCSTETTIQFAKHAELIGADVISLIFRERVYFDDQVYNHFKEVADNCNVGILIHEMPLTNGIPGQSKTIDWSLDLLDKIANLENVIAIKEDAKKDEYTRQVSDLLCDRLAVITSGYGMKQWMKFAPNAHAWLSGSGGFNPAIEVDWHTAWKNGDLEKCNQIINNVEIPFGEIAKTFGWHLGIKTAMDIMGVMNRVERMPLQQLPDQSFKQLKNMMYDIADKSDYLKKIRR